VVGRLVKAREGVEVQIWQAEVSQMCWKSLEVRGRWWKPNQECKAGQERCGKAMTLQKRRLGSEETKRPVEVRKNVGRH